MQRLFLPISTLITISFSPAQATEVDPAIEHVHEIYVKEIPAELLGCLGGVEAAIEKFDAVYRKQYKYRADRNRHTPGVDHNKLVDLSLRKAVGFFALDVVVAYNQYLLGKFKAKWHEMNFYTSPRYPHCYFGDVGDRKAEADDLKLCIADAKQYPDIDNLITAALKHLNYAKEDYLTVSEDLGDKCDRSFKLGASQLVHMESAWEGVQSLRGLLYTF